MNIFPITDAAFLPYGHVVEGYDTQPLLAALLAQTPLPETGTAYVPSEPALEALPLYAQLTDNAYGGMPTQLGWCNGHNTKLNCLEYHRDSEFNLGADDFILLLARQDEIVDGVLDTAKVKAFLCPAGTLVEVYATTLHYAPCNAKPDAGFRVMVALPRGTNTEKPEILPLNAEDKMLWARNKWLLAHAESNEAKAGAHLGLSGKNIDLALSMHSYNRR